MAKYPYFDAEIHLEDYFKINEKQTKKGKIKKRIGKYKGELLFFKKLSLNINLNTFSFFMFLKLRYLN